MDDLAAAPPIEPVPPRRPTLAARTRGPLRGLVHRLAAQAFGPYLIACAPLVASTVLAPAWVSWPMAAIALLVLYRVAQQGDAALFAMPPARGFVHCALPLNALMLVWLAAMVAAGKGGEVAATVFPYLGVLALCIAPACRWHAQRGARRVRLRLSFGAVGVLALCGHGLAALRAGGWV
jgi:hypothetical protein